MSYDKVYEDVKSIKKSYSDDDIVLVAVSKLHTYREVLIQYEKGARLFGENHVQELIGKFPIPEERPEGMKVFLIGHLQSNKIKKVIPYVDRIESVDSLKLIELLDRYCRELGKSLDILLEYNISGEENKTGFKTEEELESAIILCEKAENLNLIGFMGVGPLGFDADKNYEAFKKLSAVFERYKSEKFRILSMGMSGDYKEAIKAGSTEVRIGSLIFGKRDYDKKNN